MLKLSLHAGELDTRTHANQLAVIDIAYAKQSYLSDYLVALSMREHGELKPAMVMQYPRWSGSLWDLTARAISQLLHRTDTPPAAPKLDRRCAYATRLCGVIQRATSDDRGIELGSVEIYQTGRQRGQYAAYFEEDILGKRKTEFEYGTKMLNVADLLMRAICWAWFSTEVPGKKPSLILPPTSITLDGVERFHIESLAEPACTGFKRYLADLNRKAVHKAAADAAKDEKTTKDAKAPVAVAETMPDMPTTDNYKRFLVGG